MSRGTGALQLSVAVGDYDRTRPLLDGRITIDGVDPVFLALTPEEMFFRAFRHEAFDVCELSLSSFVLRTALGDDRYVGVPVFLNHHHWQGLSSRRVTVPELFHPSTAEIHRI